MLVRVDQRPHFETAGPQNQEGNIEPRAYIRAIAWYNYYMTRMCDWVLFFI